MVGKSLQELFGTLPQVGKVEWIGLRPDRRAEIKSVKQVNANSTYGLEGDRYAGKSGQRQVTLIQSEHLPVIASLLSIQECAPERLRRNIAVSGINLLALKNKRFKVGSALLEYTGQCHPCSFMETNFGDGGYNAVRGHGGITAKVLKDGLIELNSKVCISDE